MRQVVAQAARLLRGVVPRDGPRRGQSKCDGCSVRLSLPKSIISVTQQVLRDCFSLDLHAELATAGASDTNTVPLVHPRWNGPANQVPYTFPPPPVLFLLFVALYNLLTRPQSKHPSQALSKFKRLRYCHAFAYATCRAGTQCKFPHLTEEELEVELHKQQQVQGSSAEKLSKKGKKGKQKKAKSGGEAAPMQTEPQSPPAAAPAPSPALPARYQQAFQDLDAGVRVC